MTSFRSILVVSAAAIALASTGSSQAQDAFEDALRAAPQPQSQRMPRPSRDTDTTLGRGSDSRIELSQSPIASPGAMPARFRTMIALSRESDGAVRAAVRAGELDAFAMMEQVAGPLPIPPNARPMRCRPDHNDITFTLGVEASPEYMAAFRAHRQAYADGSSQIDAAPGASFLLSRTRLAASPSILAAKREAEQVLLAAGFVRSSGDTVGRAIYRPGPNWRGRTPIKIVFDDDTFGLDLLCEARGLDFPHGPTMTISYDWMSALRPGF